MSHTALHEMLDAAGAVNEGPEEQHSVRHFGDAAAEYQAVRASAGFIHRTDRAALRLWGRDPIRMLNGLITNDLSLLSEDHAVYAAMLTPKGRIISDLRTLVIKSGEGDELRVDIPAAAVPAVGEHLKKYVPPLFARWEVLEEAAGSIGVYGPRAGDVVERALGMPVSTTEDAVTRGEIEGGAVVAVGTSYAGGEPGCDLLAPTDRLPELWRRLTEISAPLGGRPIGFDALERLRIEAGRPRYGSEITDEMLPAEVFGGDRLQRVVSFSKGCYTGQEVVVRIAHRGHVNRHLRGLLVGGPPLPARGSALHAPESGKQVGWITSAVDSPLMRQGIALGFVRREVASGGKVRIGDDGEREVEVIELPFSREA